MARDLDPSWDQIGFPWENVAISFDPGNATIALKFTQRLLNPLLLIRRQLQVGEKLWNICGDIIFAPK